MKTLSIDIETYSDIPLQKTGVYRYCESPNFEILLFGYSIDSEPVQVVDLACGEHIPKEVLAALEDDSVIKWAFNAAFERVCLSRYLGYPTGEYLDPESWHCSMVWAATMGLPLSLEGVGAVLGLEKQKLTEGKELIKYFCQPCLPTKANGQRTRNRPFHAPDKWELFKRYNARDVEAEMGIQQKLSKFPVPPQVWEEYDIDQEINGRGVRIDMELVEQAIQMDARSRQELTDAMKRMTALENPNSVQQMKQWLSDNGMETDSLGKKVVAELLKTAPPELAEVLTLRQQLAKSSVRKYQAMEKTVCSDNRARGMFMFYGANRTGRFSGRNIQLQNLPQNHLPDLAAARALVRSGDFDTVELLYEDVPDTLSQLIRTAFIPRDGAQFLVADFSAIEARVIAWFAGETWRQEVFAKGGDIYCASASQMFKVPVEKHGVNGHLRQKGKIAELALGYGGSVGALKAMGALEMGLTEEELPQLVDAWRQCYFEKENIWTFDGKGELLLTIMSSLAQEESRSISENCTWGQRKRFADGKVTVPFNRFLGYDRGLDGNLVVNREQAAIVQRIYAMFLQGMTYNGIAQQLTADGIPSPGGKPKWNTSAVKSILSNEKYKGCALLQKTYTVDYLTKKKKVNEGEIPQYYVEDNHEAIIDPDTFEMVQREMEKRGKGRKYHSGVHTFSSKIRCGECGSWYGSKVWHSNSKYRKVIWQCNHKFDGDHHCSTPHLTDDIIQRAFLSAANKLLATKDTVIADGREMMVLLFDTTELEREQGELQQETQVVSDMVQQCIYENAHVALDQTEYQKRYDGLTERFERAKARLVAVTAEIHQVQTQRASIEDFLSAFAAMPNELTEFTLESWHGLVGYGTVYADDDIRFTFKNGQELKA